MSKIYKSARGKSIDMDKVKLSNENTRAVGNMRVNARGDLLGVGGAVTAGRNQIMDKVYAVESSPASYSPNEPAQFTKQQEAAKDSKAKELHDLVNTLAEPTALEPIIDQTSVAPTQRGTLASAVAKTTIVNQQPIVDPRKPKGPTRI